MPSDRLGNRAPPDSPRRCQARRKASGQLFCNRYALKNRRYCARHGGKQKLGPSVTNGSRIFVANFYHMTLGPTLSKFIENVGKDSPKELFDLQGELQIARASSMAILAIYDKLLTWLHEHGPRLQSKEGKTEEQIAKDHAELMNYQSKAILLGEKLRESMESVTTIAEKASNVYLKHVETIEVGQIEIIVNQLIRILYEVCGESNQKIAEEFQLQVHKKVRLPGKQQILEGGYQAGGVGISVEDMLQTMASSIALDKDTVAGHIQ